MKRLKKILTIVFLVIIISSKISYANNYESLFFIHQDKSINEIYNSQFKEIYNFIKVGEQTDNGIRIINKSGKDVTEDYLKIDCKNNSIENYIQLFNSSLENDLTFSYSEIKETKDFLGNITRAIRTTHHSKAFPVEKKSIDGFNKVGVWGVTLSGTMRYDDSTGQIISSSTPTVRFHYSGNYRPENIKSGSKILSGKVEFNCSYRMKEYQPVDSDYPLIPRDYGITYHSFYAYPY